MRRDSASPHDVSQSLDSNLAKAVSTVANLLEKKGGDIVTIRPQESVATAVTLLCERRIGALVVTDAAGQVANQKRSAKFFDADKDPIFIHGEQDGDSYRFVSFLGDVYTAHVGGEVASFDASWSILSAADRKQGWRPGGYQLIAQHNASGRLFVGMHDKGFEGSHKTPAKEIWTVDLASERDFVGKAALLAQGQQKQFLGLSLLDKGVLRAHQKVVTVQGDGEITSGTFSPTLQQSVALARLPMGVAIGDSVKVVIRDKELAAKVVKPCFARNSKSMI